MEVFFKLSFRFTSMRLLIYISFFSFLLSSCATGKLILNIAGDPVQQPPTETPTYTIYALGDAGEINDQSKAVLEQLRSIATDDVQPGTVIFLGDNIYPAGLPPKEKTEANRESKSILINQIDSLKNYKGQIVFIPGNHDWNEFRAGGLEAIKREGEFLDNVDPSYIQFLPKNGCGGPAVIELNEQLVMLIIDSQWWIQDWSKEPHINEGCAVQSKAEFIKTFHDLVGHYKNKQIIVAMHHPLYSQGSHGGHFTLKSHIFPLTAVVNWLYLPLPIIGSIYPFYRTIFGHSQDLKNKRYKSLRSALLDDLDYQGHLIFLAGHEHDLQYIREQDKHFIISGAGSKQTALADADDLMYGHKSGGFIELDFYKNGGTWLTIFEVDPKTRTSMKVFSRPILE